MKKILLICFTFSYTIGHSQTIPDYQKLSKACEFWGLIKYFDPRKLGNDFDSAFAAQVPAMLKAKNEEEWQVAITKWLEVLDDGSTRTVTKQNFNEGDLESRFIEDSVLLVKISGSKFFTDWGRAQSFASQLIGQSKKSKGVIFDLRQETSVPEEYSGWMDFFFETFGLNKHFASRIVPQLKTPYYSGFKPESGEPSPYTTGNVLRNFMSNGLYGNADPRVVWIANAYSELPGTALSQQNAGLAFILNDSERTDRLFSVSNTFEFSQDIHVMYRTGEMVLPAREMQSVDYVYKPSDDALAWAQLLVNNFKTEKAKIPLRNNSKSVSADVSGTYPPGTYPDMGYRILAAAKMYAVIQNFFPYKEFMERDWKEVLNESLPDFANAQNDVEYGLAAAKMYGNIRDGHGGMSNNKGQDKLFGDAPAPFYVDFIESKVVITSYRSDSTCKVLGVSIGDVIVKVNGITTEKLMEKYRVYYQYSTLQTINSTAARLCIRGNEGEEAKFTIADSKGTQRDLKIRWTNSYNANIKSEPRHEVLELVKGNIGYADLTRMEPGQTDEMFEKFKNTKAIIFDMRGYPRGTAWSIAPRLTEKKGVALALVRKPEILMPNVPGRRVLSQKAYTEFVQTLPPSDQWKYMGKTVMLINHEAVSQAEHTGLFFEAVNNTTFIGSPTGGMDGDVTNFVIPGGISLGFSGQGIWHNDGRQLQRMGLQPHVPVERTIKGIRAGKDEIMDKAIEWVNKNVN
jgi:C-terminal processing protease CtpA/Prc